MKFRFLLTLSFLFIIQIANSQWRNYHFSVIGPEDGLTTNIQNITQDSTGFIYFGTGQGLIRYDGNEFLNFSHNPEDSTTIGAGDVWDLLTDSRGLIWIGLRFGGLNCYSPKTGKFKRYPLPKFSVQNIPSVNAVMEDTDMNLWVGGYHFRLYKFDRYAETFETFTPDWIDPTEIEGRLSIASIIQDKFDPEILWLSVTDYRPPGSPYPGTYGLVKFNKRTKIFTPQPCRSKIIFQDDDGMLWGGPWGGGVWRYDPKTQDCFHKEIEITYSGETSSPAVRDLLEDNGFIWMTTAISISHLYKNFDYEIILNNDDLGDVNTVYRDHSGNVWFGRSTGAHIINKKNQHIKYFSLGMFGINHRLYPANFAFDDKEDIIYFTHNTNRLYQIPLDKNIEASFMETDERIAGLAFSKNGTLLFPENGKMKQWNKQTSSIEAFPNASISKVNFPKPWLMESGHQNDILLLGGNKFSWFNPDRGDYHEIVQSELPAYNESDNSLEGFSLGKNNTILLFSEKLYEVSLETNVVKQIYYDTLLNPNQLELRSVIICKNDDYWISLPSFLGRFEASGDSLLLQETYSATNGLESTWIQKLYEDHCGRIWTFSSNGINCINPETKEVRYFGTKDGLPTLFNDPVQVISVSNNRIATVSGTGLILFHPDSLWNSRSESVVPVIIKKIRIDGEILNSDSDPQFIEEIEIKAHQKIVDFEFQGLSFPNNNRVEYSYRLDGLNEDWISIGTNKFITFQSLRPRKYLFEIRAGTQLNNPPIKRIEIDVIAAFYARKDFLFFMGVLSLLMLYGLYRYRINLLQKKEREKTDQSKKVAELELKALRSQMNPHFMFNSLNSIKNYILQAEPKVAAEYLSNFAHLIRMILQNSGEKTISLQDEIDALLLYIDLEKLRFDNEFDFQCKVDEGINLEEIKLPPMILQPYIENAIWHGLMHKKSKGSLLLHIRKKSNNFIKCIIDDDGVGREEANKVKSSFTRKYKSMGMGITKDRIDIINKMDSLGINIEVVDKYDEDQTPLGTKVIITLPMQLESIY